jgi:hypothetical protein
VKRLVGLVSGLVLTHMCTHLHAGGGGAASTQGFGAGDGSTVEPYRLHSATATPFIVRHLSAVALYSHYIACR